MPNCEGLTQGAVVDCTSPLTPGVNNRLLLINFEDIDTIAYNVANPSIIEGITLKSGGKAAYAFEGVKQSLNPQYSFISNPVSVSYDHQVDFLVFDISQAQKDNLEALAYGKSIAIIENRNAPGNGNNFFEVYGVGVGLEVISNVRIPSDLDTAGAFQVQLKTSDNEGKEPKMPNTWFLTDYDSTKALVDALLTPTA